MNNLNFTTQHTHINRGRVGKMERILIIGNAGSGKTTFAKKLAKLYRLPLVHLDKLYWRDNWKTVNRQEFDALLQTELEKPQWIIDGNFNRTLPHRLEYCDTVFFFDLPVITCLLGITKRILTNYGKSREDMGGSCIEYFDKEKFSLYRKVLTFNKQHRSKYYALLALRENINIIVFRSRRQAEAFLRSVFPYNE